MNRVCPECGKITEWEKITRSEQFDIKKEKITVDIQLLRCPECGVEFEDLNYDLNPYMKAYEEYRSRKGMIHPAQIIEFRKKYNLTQKELSELLGFGGVTLSRYENGALQDEAHDQLLHFILEPSNLLRTIKQKGKVIAPRKRLVLQNMLRKEIVSTTFIEELLKKEKPDIYSGENNLDLRKVAEIIKYFTYPNAVVKSKLLKLLFYADFKYFQKEKKSITGLKYAHLQYGPVPDQYDFLLPTILEMDKEIQVRIQPIGDYFGEMYVSEKPPTSNLLDVDVMETIRYVNDRFYNFSAKSIEEFSHEEKGYQETGQCELIPYSYASELQI
jgi:putative zinc finger/helix-turn-helix YgiT family protein